MSGTTKPERYVVYWPDYALRARIAKREACAPEDVDPAHYEAWEDFDDLAAARAFLASPVAGWDGTQTTVEATGGWIEERVSIVYDPRLGWDWAQERIEP
jgi:hypothetical protein